MDTTAEFMVFNDSRHSVRDMDNVSDASELRDLVDIIDEMITEDAGRLLPSLPGPPPPPSALLSQNHRMLRQNASPPSQPVLLARGTACQPTRSFPQPPQQPPCSSRQIAQPSRGASSPAGSSRRGRGSSCSLPSKSSGCVSSQSRGGDVNMLEWLLNKPKMVVVEEPKERGMRFRYECEGRSAGSILGASSTETNKSQPAIEIQGNIENLKRVTVTVSLVTKDPPHRPHPHCLVGKDCPNGSGICVVTLNPHSNRRHSFANLGIQCVRRKELDVSLQKRRSQNIDPFQTGHTKGIEDMDMNAVRLCFQCEFEWDDGRKECVNPVVSNPIYDKKATTTSQLKIGRFNQYRGPCTGRTEIFMLCDKVQKDDIEIIFRHGSWKASGIFAQTDVHRQIAIVFKTPPYQDQDITEEVEVSVVLRRLSDQMESESVTFTYFPYNPDPYEVKRKRKIKSDTSFTEKPCVTAESAPAAEQPFHFPQQPQTMMSAEERLCPGPPAASAEGDMCYGEPQDSGNGSADVTTLLNQLVESSLLWDLISDTGFNVPAGFEQGADASAAFGNLDVNFNHNFGSYTQDFSHYSDLQFNMLVNENQAPQAEAQDSSASMVEVKKEEEL